MWVCLCAGFNERAVRTVIDENQEALASARSVEVAQARVFKTIHADNRQKCGKCLPTIGDIIRKTPPPKAGNNKGWR